MTGETSARPWKIATAILAVVALMASGIAVTEARSQTAAGAPRVQPGGRAIEAGHGVVVYPTNGALPAGSTVVASPTATQAANEVIEPVTGTYRLTASQGEPKGPVLVAIPLTSSTEASNKDLWVAHLAADGSIEEVLPAQSASGKVVTTTTSFSSFFGFHFHWDWVREQAQHFLEALTGGAYHSVEDPHCTGKVSWKVTVDPAGSPAVRYCTGTSADGAELRIVNTRRYPVTVQWPVGLSGTAPRGGMAEQLSDLIENSHTDVLPPGAEMAIHGPSGATGKVKVAFDGAAQSLSALLVASDLIAFFAEHLPGVHKGGEAVLEELHAVGCLRDMGIDPGRPPASVTGDLTTAIRDCLLNKTMLKRLGLTGLLSAAGTALIGAAGVFGGTIAFLWGSSSAIIDQLTGDGTATLRIGSSTSGRPQTAGPTTTTTPGSSGSDTTVASGPAKLLGTYTMNVSDPTCSNVATGGRDVNTIWTHTYGAPVAGRNVGSYLGVNPNDRPADPACADFAIGADHRTRLSGFVGVTDHFAGGAAVHLTFYGDGRKLASFDPVLGQRYPLDLNVAGVSVLRIEAVVTRAGTTSRDYETSIVASLT